MDLYYRANGVSSGKLESQRDAAGTGHQQHVGGLSARVDAGSDLELTSQCESDEDADDDDASISRMSSTTTEHSDMRYTRRHQRRHRHRHRPAAVVSNLHTTYCHYFCLDQQS